MKLSYSFNCIQQKQESAIPTACSISRMFLRWDCLLFWAKTERTILISTFGKLGKMWKKLWWYLNEETATLYTKISLCTELVCFKTWHEQLNYMTDTSIHDKWVFQYFNTSMYLNRAQCFSLFIVLHRQLDESSSVWLVLGIDLRIRGKRKTVSACLSMGFYMKTNFIYFYLNIVLFDVNMVANMRWWPCGIKELLCFIRLTCLES